MRTDETESGATTPACPLPKQGAEFEKPRSERPRTKGGDGKTNGVGHTLRAKPLRRSSASHPPAMGNRGPAPVAARSLAGRRWVAGRLAVLRTGEAVICEPPRAPGGGCRGIRRVDPRTAAPALNPADRSGRPVREGDTLLRGGRPVGTVEAATPWLVSLRRPGGGWATALPSEVAAMEVVADGPR